MHIVVPTQQSFMLTKQSHEHKKFSCFLSKLSNSPLLIDLLPHHEKNAYKFVTFFNVTHEKERKYKKLYTIKSKHKCLITLTKIKKEKTNRKKQLRLLIVLYVTLVFYSYQNDSIQHLLQQHYNTYILYLIVFLKMKRLLLYHLTNYVDE